MRPDLSAAEAGSSARRRKTWARRRLASKRIAERGHEQDRPSRSPASARRVAEVVLGEAARDLAALDDLGVELFRAANGGAVVESDTGDGGGVDRKRREQRSGLLVEDLLDVRKRPRAS